MQELFPRHFVAAIGNDLIGVHVRLRSASRLPYDKREMLVELSGNHLVRGRANNIFLFFG